MAVVDRVRELVAPVVADVGAELYDVEFNGGILRILVDADGGIDIDQSATFDNVQGTGLSQVTIESVFLDNFGPNFIEEAGDPVDLSNTFTTNIVEGMAGLAGNSFVIGARGIVPGVEVLAVTPLDPTTLGLEPGSFLGAVDGGGDTTFDGWTFSE